MKVQTPRTVQEAEAIQDELRALLDLTGPGPLRPVRVAGVDVAYDRDRPAAAVTVLDGTTPEVAEEVVVRGKGSFDHVPGLPAFREVPALLDALERLSAPPCLVVCGGYGVAYPRRSGLACHNVLNPTPRHRLPETIRVADRLSRRALTENCRSALVGSTQHDRMG